MPSIAQLLPLLGKDYEQKCTELGIIKRVREIKTPADLMMLCLFHLLNGVSLVAVSTVAFALKIGNFSDVAFMKKFAKCGEWFKQISAELSRDGLIAYPKPAYLEGRRVLAVDASDVVENGRSGETYRLHYAIDLHTMTSDTFKITKEEIGEKLSNFDFRRGDLVVVDRAYGTLNGMKHCLNCGADYILRLRTGCFAVYDENGNKFDIAGIFAGLKSGESGEAAVFAVLPDKTRIPVRICVKRKDKEGGEKSLKRRERRASRKGNNLQDKTVEFNEYIVVVTSLPDSVTAEEVLETYRRRWQAVYGVKRRSLIWY
ncbi:MAG: transposase [Spirochaetaceae bacterium]|jgi:hypothetical protein|nr:transposase [Spirochaetaceae bacterium]